MSERAWRFEFLHPGIVRSIISRVGSRAGESAVYWKYGVWFYDATTQSSAVIAQQMEGDRQGRIVLQTQGDLSRVLLESVTKLITKCVAQINGAVCTIEGDPLGMRADELEASPQSLEPADRESSSETIRITDPPPPPNERQACVSYAWKEERSKDPTRAGKVDEFCAKLNTVGAKIIRDTTHVSLGDRLSSFMRGIGHSDRVYIFLSDAYLKSPNCMYELLTIWQTSGDDEEQFRLRTRVFTMPGTDVFSIPARLKYATYWKTQREKILQLINESGVDVLGPTDLKHFKQIQDFAHHVNEMLAQVANVLQPSDFDQYIGQAMDELHPSH